MNGILNTDTLKREASAIIINKLNSICDRLDKNDQQHEALRKTLAELKLSAQGDHPNCKTGIVNTKEIENVSRRLDSREKWGLAITVVMCGGVISALIAALI